MREDLLYFIWKINHFTFNGRATTDGESIEIIHPGDYNPDSGPDFFNAKIRIGETIWAGNVEMHVNSSDWYSHKHQVDSAFDNVILHVVVNNDKVAVTSKERVIPTLKIEYPDRLDWDLMHLTSSGKWIPCENSISLHNQFTIRMWLESILVERFEQKTNFVLDLVNQNQGSWEEAFYISMAKSFGLKANTIPFEMLTKATPLKILSKHKNSLFQLEALLFGQSGLLPETGFADEYSEALSKEYNYLRNKFNLKPIQGHLWKFLRMRPTAFPTIRIAQFAYLVYNSASLFSKIIEIRDIKDILRLIDAETSEYWKTHYIFGKESDHSIKHLGESTIRIIAINSIVPFLFAYGIKRNNPALREKAVELLEGIKPETNTITQGFLSLGIKAESAFYSQALIHLKTNYCDPKKCLYCHLGAKLLLKSVGS